MPAYTAHVEVPIGQNNQGQTVGAAGDFEIEAFDIPSALDISVEKIDEWRNKVRSDARQQVFQKQIALPNGHVVR